LQKTGAVGSQDAGSELSAIEARLTAVDEQLRREFPEYANLANPEPLTIAEVQAQLRSDEVLVQFVEAPKVAALPSEIFVWAIDKQRSRWASVELDGQAVDRLVRALRCGLDDGQGIASAQNPGGPSQCRQLLDLDSQAIGRHPLPFDLKRSHLLYRALLGSVEDLVKDKHILVVPSGVLGSLPFHVLVTEAPGELAEGSDAYRKARWLIARQAITVLPSVASLKALRRAGGTGQASRAYAAFGNPLLDGDATSLGHVERTAAARDRQGCPASPTLVRLAAKETRLALKPLARGGVADVTAIRRLLPLPETSDELCTVAANLGAQPTEVRLGALATETGIKALSANGQLGEYRIIHFATHGALSGEIEGNAEPGLILTPPKLASELDDGYLTASEIAALKLDADWVILSACNTAAAAGPADAESLSGLARAFFYAGARSLLVSHWAVDSDATVELITKAFGAMRAEPRIGRAEALRRSMLALIESGGRLSHPAIWAPFVVVGEGGVAVSSSAVKAAPKGTTRTKVQKSVPRSDWRTQVFGR
jgi:CHAT domain-containing protein